MFIRLLLKNFDVFCVSLLLHQKYSWNFFTYHYLKNFEYIFSTKRTQQFFLFIIYEIIHGINCDSRVVNISSTQHLRKLIVDVEDDALVVVLDVHEESHIWNFSR
jgi:hypothetical protein